MTIDVNMFRETELSALRQHQQRIKSRDKNKRARAMKEYRVFLDYLERIGRITPAQKVYLENFRLEDRQVNG